jgi:hypothetical protein
MRLAYTVWFRNLQMEPDEQDCEWVAVFLVEAGTEEAAQSWGDLLAKSCAFRNPKTPADHVDMLEACHSLSVTS